MRKKLFVPAVLFFILSFFILYFSPGIVETIKKLLNTSDLLFPFSIYEALVTKGSRPDWIYGGNTPWLDIVVGFLFWLVTRNIQLTLTLVAIFQPVLMTLCLVYLSTSLVGRNWKVIALTIVFSTLPILLYSTGQLKTMYFIFSWYIHFSTICSIAVLLGALVRYLVDPSQQKRIVNPTLWFIFLLSAFTVFSDASILPQFIAPAVAVVVLLYLLKLVPFRRAVYASLTILYSAGAGFVIYMLPRLWGSDRVVILGSYVHTESSRIADNISLFWWNIAELLEGKTWIIVIWAAFYMLCAYFTLSLLSEIRQGKAGIVRQRLLVVYLFLPVEMVISIIASFTTNDGSTRYFLPAVYFPLFWGWPLLALGRPAWMKRLSERRAARLGYALVGIALVLLGRNILISLPQPLPSLTDHYPAFTACLDENAKKYNLRRGIAHYWQARENTLLSKQDLFIVQVYSDLSPMRYLNNSDFYQDEMDFVIIDNQPPQGNWIDRNIVYDRFGQPALTFTCGNSDILVYNRPGDIKFRQQYRGTTQANNQ